jgi:gamma-glutamyltranspeptidase/glutathione hydrolase
MDRWGNVVAQTQSIERFFGSKVATSELGFFYNGYMKTFKVKNRRHPFYLTEGAVARSNAAPAIVFQGGTPIAALGTTGSERLASGIFETLIRLRKGTPFDAVMAPRIHCTPEGEVLLEKDRFPEDAIRELEKCGFRITAYDPWGFSGGGLHLVTFDGKIFEGVADPRRDGMACGPLK